MIKLPFGNKSKLLNGNMYKADGLFYLFNTLSGRQ